MNGAVPLSIEIDACLAPLFARANLYTRTIPYPENVDLSLHLRRHGVEDKVSGIVLTGLLLG
jgi:hypothetical protein